MSNFQQYRRKVVSGELRTYEPGEDLSGISVEKNYTPKEGDMIARNPDKVTDQWLVSKEYFEANFLTGK